MTVSLHGRQAESPETSHYEEVFDKVIIIIQRRIKLLLAEPNLDLPRAKLYELLERPGKDNHGLV